MSFLKCENERSSDKIRSKAKWINEVQKNTKFFLGLEKSHQTLHVIKELKKAVGK